MFIDILATIAAVTIVAWLAFMYISFKEQTDNYIDVSNILMVSSILVVFGFAPPLLLIIVVVIEGGVQRLFGAGSSFVGLSFVFLLWGLCSTTFIYSWYVYLGEESRWQLGVSIGMFLAMLTTLHWVALRRALRVHNPFRGVFARNF